MRKPLVIAGASIGLVVLAIRLRAMARGVDWHKKTLERMEKAFERMPEDSPPKWMLRNITAIRRDTAVIRHNTDRILDQLQQEQANRAQPASPASTQ